MSDGSRFATFPAPSQHIAQNKHGVFVSYLSASNVVFNANTLKIDWIKDNGDVISLQSPTGARISASNSGAVEVFSTGEVYLIWSNYIDGGIYIEKWQDVSNNTVSVRTVVTGDGTANGKFGTAICEARRHIYFLGTSGYFFTFNDDGGLVERHAFLNTTQNPNYFSLVVGSDSLVHATWSTASTLNGLCNYNSVMTAINLTPGETPTYWTATAGKWRDANMGGTSTLLTTPIVSDDTGPAMPCNYIYQNRGMNCVIVSSTLLSGNNLVVLYGEVSHAFRSAFEYDDLRSCTMGLSVLDLDLVYPYYNIIRHVPLKVGNVIPRAFSGGVCQRQNAIYVVAPDRDSLIALKSTDSGKSFKVIAQTPFPYSGDNHMLHYCGIARGDNTDEDIIGVVTEEFMSPSVWANTTLTDIQARVWTWKLRI